MREVGYILTCLAVAGLFLVGGWQTPRGDQRETELESREIPSAGDPRHPASASEPPGSVPECGKARLPVFRNGSTRGTGRDPSSISPGAVQLRAEQQLEAGPRRLARPPLPAPRPPGDR